MKQISSLSLIWSCKKKNNIVNLLAKFLQLLFRNLYRKPTGKKKKASHHCQKLSKTSDAMGYLQCSSLWEYQWWKTLLTYSLSRFIGHIHLKIMCHSLTEKCNCFQCQSLSLSSFLHPFSSLSLCMYRWQIDLHPEMSSCYTWNTRATSPWR